MLRYLAHPYELAGTVVAVALGVYLHNLTQVVVARWLGDRSAQRAGYLSFSPSRQLDPLGIVAAALTYYAWGFCNPVPLATRPQRQRPRAAVALMAGPVWLFVQTLAFVGLVRAAGDAYTGSALDQFATLAALSSAGLCVTSLLPFPPLSLGRALFLYAPTSPGWQRARYQLEETQIGRLIVFAILMLPVLFVTAPDIVGQLTTPLLHLADNIISVFPQKVKLSH